MDGTVVTLASTGSNLIYYIGIGALLVIAGLVVFFVSRKKLAKAK